MTEPPLPPLQHLPNLFFRQETETVARKLLGILMLRRVQGTWIGGRIVETEAYLHINDFASHSARGLGKSNAAMFDAAGTIYVYPIHAKVCFNIVTQSKNVGAAVLIRALEPLWGIETMKELRGVDSIDRLTSGPAMLCQSLAIERDLNGHRLHDEPDLMLTQPETTLAEAITVSHRIGINKSADLPLRFFLRGNRFVSGPKAQHCS
jgi:DNA-3-methyladenine glycosylase